MSTHDVAVVGGGPAGLSAALVLARACRRVVVFDSGTPRNEASPGVQGFLSRDGVAVNDLRRVAREQIEKYGTVDFRETPVVDITRIDGGLVVATEDERHEVAFAVLAMGVVDTYPEIEGFAELWGRRIIHCAFCHGWENRARPWGIVATRLDQVEGAGGFRPWTDDIMVFADPDLDIPEAVRQDLEGADIPIVQRRIRGLVVSAGDLEAVELDDGTRIARGTLVFRPEQKQTSLVTRIGVDLDDDGRVRVDADRQTSVRGVYAAGDLTRGCQDALSAAGEGAAIARRIAGLLTELWRNAADTRPG